MANIAKTISATRVKYSLIRVIDGIVVPDGQPDAVFPGLLTEDKAKRMLTKRLGKDVMFAITGIEAAQHRYVMTLEEFVRAASIEDADDADDSNDGENEDPAEGTDEPADDAGEDEANEDAPPEEPD